ncbi:MAG: GNAT family N-acetyltransferase [Nitrospirae bacterium]|nr:GNAT family N-acetyltransferase [Nitrospirota bacterium]
MEIQLIKADTADCFKSSELMMRASESSKSLKTKHYRVIADCGEVAFVSLDRWPEPEISRMVIYEIFVLRNMRRKGIGTALLTEIEKVAMQEGFRKTYLRPSTLDCTFSQTDMVNWYLCKGYNFDLAMTGSMQKQL